ncbi:MAG: class I SAM-dependent DNA methyltransferase, partial [Selenomonadaceae bacterium]|nr:class I SAM-dependent DNA methyltransferase [Selenomonadaceae bacterium]
MNKDAAKNFAFKWNGHGDEERDYQIFWLTMLRDVFDVAKPEEIIEPQYPVQFETATKHADIYIPKTKVLIEQKNFGDDLTKKYQQSDGELLTPFEQAKRYADAMPLSIRPRWIIVCNFAEFHIYDLLQMDSLEYLLGTKIYKPTVLKLENFQSDFARLNFIVDPNADFKPEIKISTDAAKIVRKICLAIDKNYVKRDNDYIDALSKLCARLVFCFYADDEKLFADTKFADYLKDFSESQLQDALQNFFDALNTPEDKRDALKNFPYVDGGLFDEKIPIPPLDKNFKFAVERAHIFDDLRLDELGNFIKFSWREINPTIFGAMFEALFNEETRRSEGIHYTSIENIHKVIDPLFFDDLSAELAAVKRMQKKNRVVALKNFQDKLAAIKIFDPACGSGNFLTETYLSLRRLENEVLAELRSLKADIPAEPVKVSPQQFYGIEINDFAVSVAKLALWIAEIQMLRKTSWIIGRELKELPLRKNISVQKANALRVDWKDFATNVDYIIGNPPFHGARNKTSEQTVDIQKVFSGWQNVGNLDYVTCWHKLATDFMKGNDVRAAFVSTNSICQGDSIGTLWKNLFAAGNHIDFAHRTFKWQSESDNPAHVHCVVVGFSSAPNPKPKKIFDGEKVIIAKNINAYLVDGEDIFVESRPNPIQDFVPKIVFGSMPNDGGNLIIEADDLDNFLK